MIVTPTVFVLGAGASKPFGFPIGVELSDNVVSGIAQGGAIFQALERIRVPALEMANFRRAFMGSGFFSVDAFLERRDEFMDIGKLATAHVLISEEREERLFRFNDSWLKILYNRMAGTFDELRKNNVSFITFNYDRNIEHFFYSAITNSHNRPSEEVRALMEEHIPIVHLHGRLGYLPWQTDDASKTRPYSPASGDAALRVSADNIKIIHEDTTDGRDKEFAQAKTLLDKAQKIVLLGFGYNRRNIDRLGIRNLPPGKAFGTCQGLGAFGEKQAKLATDGKVQLVGGDCTHIASELLDWD
jgi:hypothetical protein